MTEKEIAKEKRAARYKREKDKFSARSKKWRLNNTEKQKEYIKEWKMRNKEKVKEHAKKYNDKISTKTKRNEKDKESYNSDPLKKLCVCSRNRISKFLDGKVKSASTQKIVGCSWEDLKVYIESLFKEGMSWENYGINGWHVDHIIPLSSGKTLEEIEKLCHFSNLQPLWWHENLSKGAKIITH